MAGNPLVDQGSLNRLRASVIVGDSPELNVTPSYLGKEGIRLQLEGDSVTYLPTMVGGVISEEPYQIVRITMQLLKSQPLADLYKARVETDASIGNVTVRGDSRLLSPYEFTNCSIMNPSALDFGGGDPGYVAGIRGYYNINSGLFG